MPWRQVLKEQSRASAESSSKIVPLLKQDISTKRLELLAASPPFVLALEQALVTVVSVEQATSPGSTTNRTRSAPQQASRRPYCVACRLQQPWY